MMLTLKKKTLIDFFCGPAPYSEDPCCTALRCRIRINLKYKQIVSIFHQGVNGDLWPLNAGTALPERAHRSGTSSESLHLLEQQHPSVRIPFDTWKQSYLVHQFECVTSTNKIKQKKNRHMDKCVRITLSEAAAWSLRWDVWTDGCRVWRPCRQSFERWWTDVKSLVWRYFNITYWTTMWWMHMRIRTCS